MLASRLSFSLGALCLFVLWTVESISLIRAWHHREELFVDVEFELKGGEIYDIPSRDEMMREAERVGARFFKEVRLAPPNVRQIAFKMGFMAQSKKQALAYAEELRQALESKVKRRAEVRLQKILLFCANIRDARILDRARFDSEGRITGMATPSLAISKLSDKALTSIRPLDVIAWIALVISLVWWFQNRPIDGKAL